MHRRKNSSAHIEHIHGTTTTTKISLKFLSKGTLIYHLFIFEIPTNQTCSGQSHSLKQVSWAQPAASCGHAGQAVRTSLHETPWQACNSLQAQEAKELLSVKRDELSITFHFIFCNFSVRTSQGSVLTKLTEKVRQCQLTDCSSAERNALLLPKWRKQAGKQATNIFYHNALLERGWGGINLKLLSRIVHGKF